MYKCIQNIHCTYYLKPDAYQLWKGLENDVEKSSKNIHVKKHMIKKISRKVDFISSHLL